MNRCLTYILYVLFAVAARSIYLSLRGEQTSDPAHHSVETNLANIALANPPSRIYAAQTRAMLSGSRTKILDFRTTSSSSDEYSSCRHEGTSEMLPHFPTFIIVGAQKAGTSALYHILKQHPNISASPKVEPHFFDRRGDLDPNPESYNSTTICRARQAYANMFDFEEILSDPIHPKLSFEKTPSYMVYPHVPALIKRICPWTKILISLRNPIDRLHSSYLGDDMEGDLMRQLDALRRSGLINAPSLDSFHNSSSDMNAYDFRVTRRIRQAKNQKGPLAANGVSRGFYAVQLAHWLQHFPLGTSLKVIRFEELRKQTGHQQDVLKDILEFIGAPPFQFSDDVLSAVYGPNNGPNRKQRAPLRNATRRYLQQLYNHYNDELAQLLGKEWQGVWDS